MASTLQGSVRSIHDLKAGVEYEGRPRDIAFPLVRGTFKKVIVEDGTEMAVFDPMYTGKTEYDLKVNTYPPEDVAIMFELYDFYPLRIEATKKFERNVRGMSEALDRRSYTRALSPPFNEQGRYLNQDVVGKITDFVVGPSRTKAGRKSKRTRRLRNKKRQKRTIKSALSGVKK